jgi:hypothetical protein
MNTTTKPKKKSHREKITDALISCLVAREGMLDLQNNTYLLPKEREANLARRRQDLAAAQFTLEKLMMKRLNYLTGVDRAYGIKHRPMRYLSATPSATTSAAA